MPNQYNPQAEAAAGAVELGAAGILTSAAGCLAGVGQVTVATIATAAGATTVAVSLPAVVAVCAAGCLGFSLGGRMVKALNQSVAVPGNTPNRQDARA